MKLNEICCMVTQLPEALIHSDSTLDDNVQTGITGMSGVGPVLLCTHCNAGGLLCYTSCCMPVRMERVKRLSTTGRST